MQEADYKIWGYEMLKRTIIASVFVLAGCETIENNTELVGAGVGALVGGAACAVSSANDTECALLVIGGAAAGFAIAKVIDKEDEDAYRLATNDVLNDGKASSTRVSSQSGTPITATKVETAATTDQDGMTECETLNYDYKQGFQETYCKNSQGAWVKV